MTGRLDLALVQLSNYLERDLETRSRINQALAYPMVVLGMAVVTVAVLAVWVLPKFATFFKRPRREAAAVDPACSSASRTSPRTTGGSTSSVLVGDRRRCRLYLWTIRAGPAHPQPRDAAHPAGQGHRPLLRRRTRHADPRRDVARRACRSPTRWRPRSAARTTSCSKTACRARRSACSKAKASPGRSRDTGLFPEAAIQMMRVGENTGTLDVQLENASDYYSPRARVQAQEAHHAVRARGHRGHGARRRLRRGRARAGDVRHLLQPGHDEPQVRRGVTRGGGATRHRTLIRSIARVRHSRVRDSRLLSTGGSPSAKSYQLRRQEPDPEGFHPGRAPRRDRDPRHPRRGRGLRGGRDHQQGQDRARAQIEVRTVNTALQAYYAKQTPSAVPGRRPACRRCSRT